MRPMSESRNLGPSRRVYVWCHAVTFIVLIGLYDLQPAISLRAKHAGGGLARRRGTPEAADSCGAPLDPVDAAQQTPLLLAVKNDHVAAAILLIEAGSNINAQSSIMDSPWLLAGALGRAEMLRKMIPKRPDFSLRNRFGGNTLI